MTVRYIGRRKIKKRLAKKQMSQTRHFFLRLSEHFVFCVNEKTCLLLSSFFVFFGVFFIFFNEFCIILLYVKNDGKNDAPDYLVKIEEKDNNFQDFF